jgi:hypothetical protein
MSIVVKNTPRSLEDLRIAYASYSLLWMEFVTNCPELLDTKWFYEGAGITDEKAVDFRRLVAVWVMLYGVDVARIMVPLVDFELANVCSRDLKFFMRGNTFEDVSDQYSNVCVLCISNMIHAFRQLIKQHRLASTRKRYAHFIIRMQALNLDAFKLAVVIQKVELPDLQGVGK